MNSGQTSSAGQGYVVAPTSGQGPGVLVLHSWWGLTDFFRSVCDRLADEGFVALAPDLHGRGRTAQRPDEAEALLASTDPNQTAGLVLASVSTLRSMPATPDRPIGVIGFSMGGSWGLWAAARLSHQIDAAVTFYGGQDIDFSEATASFQGHFADNDTMQSADATNYLEAQLRLDGRAVEFHRYTGTGHWFMESDRPAAHDPAAAEIAWSRTVEFLHDHLDR